MSSGDLFDMELEWGEEKNKIEIDAQFLFQEMQKELKELILEQQVAETRQTELSTSWTI